MSIKKLLFFIIFLLTIFSLYIFGLDYAFGKYRQYLFSLIKIPDIKTLNDSKTTTLKIYSKDNNIIFEKYMSYGDTISVEEDFKEFDVFYERYVEMKGEDPIKSKLWGDFYGQLKEIYFEYFFKDALKNEFYKRLDEKYKPSELYEAIFNNFVFSNGIKGVNGYSLYLFSKKFSELHFKEKVFLALAALENINDPEDSYGKIFDDSSLISRSGRKIFINYPQAVAKYPDYLDGVFGELDDLDLNFKEKSYEIFTNLDEKKYADFTRLLRDSLKGFKGVEASLVLIDYQNKKTVLTIGTINDDYGRNRALKVKREVGSIFKPVTFLTAFQRGIRPSFVLEDKPYEFKEGNFIYRPKNYKDFYMGKTNIRNGLIYSLNNLTIKLAEKAGLNNVAYMANRIGFKDIKPFYAMPLGSIPQTPFDVAYAYSTLANYGKKCEMKFIDSVVADDGSVVQPNNECKRVADEKSVYQTLYLMKKVVSSGTARGKGLIKGTAGKTGTTNDSKDVWFAAIFPPYVAVLWVGYDNFKSLGEDASGGQIAAPIMAEIERKLLPGVTNIQFKVPEGISMVKVVKGEDKLFDSGCGSFYYEMLNKNNLPDVCIADSLNVATKED